MDNGLLAAVENKYGLTIQLVEVIRDTSRTFVVKITATQGIFILKRMYIDEHRLQFILEAEDFLRSRGIHIPTIYPTNTNKKYFTYKGYKCVLQQWICAVPYPLTSLDKTLRLAEILGNIHAISKEYQPAFASFCNGSARWEREYEEALRYLERWKNSSSFADEPWRTAVLAYIDFYITTGKYVLENIRENAYFLSWKENQPNFVLSHNDFHTQNILLHESIDIYIIDWEFVRLDFPSRDINRLLYAMLRKSRAWNHQVFIKVIRAYLKQNKLSNHEMKLLYLDLAFPHNLCRNLIWGKFNRMTGDQINDLLQKEQDKTVYLLEAYRK